ncbi:MarR family winged helix-turn-helix transcriptional regulator [Streptomyces thermocoprophilus]|uniref:MarR family winged helix-turn-helix transcriptional regulator n=1 Tax=Streptomyces thermocoprophilus TaxID=78356 RepID=UPI003618F678
MLHGHASARACDLGATDLYALNILQLGGPMTPGELGTRTGLTTGPTTRLVDRLERAGYVRRTPDPEDRRKVIVEPVGKPADLDLVMAPPARRSARSCAATRPNSSTPCSTTSRGPPAPTGRPPNNSAPAPPPRNDRRRRSRERAAGHHRGGRTGLRRPARRAERPVGTDGPPPPRPAGPQGCRREHRHARPVPAPGTRNAPRSASPQIRGHSTGWSLGESNP